MQDEGLILAHLLGGTNGINIWSEMSDAEITVMVATALRVVREIERQTASEAPTRRSKGE